MLQSFVGVSAGGIASGPLLLVFAKMIPSVEMGLPVETIFVSVVQKLFLELLLRQILRPV